MQRRLLISAAILTSVSLVIAVYAQETPPPPGQARASATRPAPAPTARDSATAQQQISYALGRNFAANLTESEIDCDLEFLIAGISDALRNAPPKWTDAECQAVLDRFGQEMQQKAMSRMQQQAPKNQQVATKFLAENAKREGVQTTSSGLQYRVIRQGDGPSPTLNDKVLCNYRGTLLNGTEFDSSVLHGGPADFRVDEVIPGWTEALQKMRVGDKWQLFVPPTLGYELKPPGPPIEPNSLLIFEIELLKILPQ